MDLKAQIKIEAESYEQFGYNKSQAKSLAWADYFEEKLARIEAKYQGNFDAGYAFDCYCFDCKKGNKFGAPSTIKLFIEEHKGHKTKTMVIK